MSWKSLQTIRWMAFGLLLSTVLLPFTLDGKAGAGGALLPLVVTIPIGIGYDLQNRALGKSVLIAMLSATIIVAIFSGWMALTDAPGQFSGREEDWFVAVILWGAMFICVVGARACKRKSPDESRVDPR